MQSSEAQIISLINLLPSGVPTKNWTTAQVVNWAQRCKFTEAEIQLIKEHRLNGPKLAVLPDRQFIQDLGFAKTTSHLIWSVIDSMKQSSAEAEVAQLKTQVSALKEQVAALTGQLVQKLKDSSPSSAAQHAAVITKEDTAECFKGLHNATDASFAEFQPNEGNLILQIIEHFSSAKLGLIDTHERCLIAMDNKPDICVVVNKPKSQPSALSVVAVIELMKENLTAARGHVVKDLLELADLQPNRATFMGIFANTEQIGFLRITKTASAANPISFVQSAVMPWCEGSTWLWQLLNSDADLLGFIPPVALKIDTTIFTTQRHKHSGSMICRLEDPLVDGTMKGHCVIAPCWIEDSAHMSPEVGVIIKYNKTGDKEEIAREVQALERLQDANEGVDITACQPLLLPVPLLLGHGTTPVEKYPYIVTYPFGAPITEVQDFVSFATELNLALVYAHSKGLYHGDVAPKNVVMHCNKPVLIDWGYAMDKGEVILGFTGTLTFASVAVTNLHGKIKAYTYQARDDFESLFFSLLYLASGNSLPWTKNDLPPGTSLAYIKKLAVTTEWKNTAKAIMNNDLLPLFDAMQLKLFGDLSAPVTSLIDGAEEEIKRRKDGPAA